MLVPELKKVAYDPARFTDIETVDEAVEIILTPTEGMTAKQRWADEAPALMRLMERFIEPNSFVLDYGCGIGRLAKPIIQKLGCRVVGVDISSNMRALATSLVDSDAFCAVSSDMFDYFFAPVNSPLKFDAAISVWALQHCVDIDRAIDRIAYSVHENGKLFIVNNKGNRCIPVEGGDWADDGLDIEIMIKDAGFREIEQGRLDESVAPGWMQTGTFWAAYERT